MFVVRRGNDIPTDGRYWPTHPERKASFTTSFKPSNGWESEPFVAGVSNDFFVLEPGDTTANLTRYVDGKPSWTVKTRRGRPIQVIANPGGDPLVLTGDTRRENLHTFARFDRKTGKKVWSLEFLDGEEPDFDEHGIFIARATDDGKVAIVKYDYDTGEPADQIVGDQAGRQGDRIFLVDSARATAQRYDLDFQPIGDELNLENTGGGNDLWRFATGDDDLLEPDDWLYAVNDSIVVESVSGKLLARCESPYDSFIYRLLPIGDGLLAIQGFDAITVVRVADGACEKLWERDVDGVIYVMGTNINFTQFAGLTAQFESDLVDAATGTSITGIVDQVYNDKLGRLLIKADGKVTVTEPGSGDELWSLDVSDDTIVRFNYNMVVLLTPDDELEQATVEVYAD